VVHPYLIEHEMTIELLNAEFEKRCEGMQRQAASAMDSALGWGG